MSPAELDEVVVERTVHVDAPPEVVFDLYTTTEGMLRWQGLEAELDPRPGGVYRLVVNEGHHELGEFVEVDRPRRIVHTYGWERDDSPLPPGSSVVEITLTRDGDGTILHVVHRSLPPAGHGVARGWDHYLPRLAVVAAGGDPGPDPWVS